MPRFALAASALAVGLATSSAPALNIVLDYSNDTGYFAGNVAAKATIERAAFDLSSLITTSLGATQDVSVGTYGSSSVTFDHRLSYTNPSTGSIVGVSNAAVPQNQFRIYVGRHNLSGTTLAQGGPGGYGFNGSASYFAGELPGATLAAAAVSTANMTRGGGPIMGTTGGTFGTTPFSINYGATLGNLWFDSDTNNDGVADTDSAVNSYFQTDYTQPVGAGKIDLYSVALHEMLHSLGLGVSQSWTQNIGGDGNDWLGANVQALLGSGDNLVSDGHDHINAAYGTSTIYGSTLLQTAVMVPSIGSGERRYLTTLDAAFLRDLGWSIQAVPEPTAIAAVAIGAMAVRRRRRGTC